MNAIADNMDWMTAEYALMTAAVEGFTAKLSIAAHDVYAKVGYCGGRPVYIDITLGHSTARERLHEDRASNELATQAVSNARAMLEVICRQATELLKANVWTLDDLIAAWRGSQFEPAGACPQVEGIASSPLDAMARYLERRQR